MNTTQIISNIVPGTDIADADHGTVTVVKINRIPNSNGKREIISTNGTEYFSRIVAGAQRITLA